MTLAKTIEHSLWSALERHIQSAYGTVAQLAPATGPGQPVKISGFFFIENVCKEVAATVETHLADIAKEPNESL